MYILRTIRYNILYIYVCSCFMQVWWLEIGLHRASVVARLDVLASCVRIEMS